MAIALCPAMLLVTLALACQPDALDTEPGALCDFDPAPAVSALTRIGEHKYEADAPEEAWDDVIVNLLDVVVDWEREWILAAGEGGVIVAEGLAGEPRTLSMFTDGDISRFHALARLGDDHVVATNRNSGIWFLALGDDGQLAKVAQSDLFGAAGVAVDGQWLYLARHDGTIETWNVADPTTPRRVGTTAGLGNAWRVVVDGDRLYVADNARGLAVLDRSDPAAPVLIAEIPLQGGVQDLALYGEHLYAAVGAAGIEVLSLADRDAPRSVALLSDEMAIVSVAAADGLLWATDHEGVRAYDLADPGAPEAIGSLATDEWALHVDAGGDRAVIADWGDLDVVELDRSLRSPDLEVSPDELIFYDDADHLVLTLTNGGGAPLYLDGLCAESDTLVVEADLDRLDPGASLQVSVTLTDPAEDFDSHLSLLSNDPQAPRLEVPVSTGSVRPSAIAVGEQAVDFVLQDLDGVSHRLSEQKDKPVFLMFFATW